MGSKIIKSAPPRKQLAVKTSLLIYDVFIFMVVDILLFVLYRGQKAMSASGVLIQSALAFVCIFGVRCECQRKSEPSANQYLSHLCERILEPPTPKVTANT